MVDVSIASRLNMKVTILIPHYKTLELTKLCLRLLRKYTNPALAKVIVIDNDSQDASTEYLRSLNWIELIERRAIPGESPALSHSRALDLALQEVTTPYVLSIHTDTLVKRDDWLDYLLAKIESDTRIAGVGSWKLEFKTTLQRLFKAIERYIQSFYYYLIRHKEHALEGIGKNYYYLRSHCALYRTALLKQYQLSFSDNEEVAGKVMHKKLLAQGYKMLFLDSIDLGKYLDHINHATMVLNPDLGARQTTITKGLERIKLQLNKLQAQQVLADNALDH